MIALMGRILRSEDIICVLDHDREAFKGEGEGLLGVIHLGYPTYN